MMSLTDRSITTVGLKMKGNNMVNKENKKTYDSAFVEIIPFNNSDVIVTSDLFEESGNPSGSTSSGSWT